MNGRILTSCNVLSNFKVRKKLKMIESPIETLRTTMEPILITNTTGTPLTKENLTKKIGIECLLL
eukprot:08910.XXX_64734_64972_1 [CDS] Oithona nana genome sequencing.